MTSVSAPDDLVSCETAVSRRCEMMNSQEIAAYSADRTVKLTNSGPLQTQPFP